MLDGLYAAVNVDAENGVAAPESVAVIACGALSHEIQYLRTINGWDHVKLFCLDADLHNRPQLIPGKLRDKIASIREQHQKIFVAYADCGTAGEIDKVLDEQGIERLPGAHCYSFYAGEKAFEKLADEEPGTFYLTDFLARHFDRLIIRGLKLDRYPQLRDDYFGNYRRLVYLSQREDESLMEAARAAARRLELEFEHVHCGYGDLESGLKAQLITVS